MSTDERTKLKVAAAECGQTYGDFVMDAVAAHEKRKERRSALDASPLHAVGRDE